MSATIVLDVNKLTSYYKSLRQKRNVFVTAAFCPYSPGYRLAVDNLDAVNEELGVRIKPFAWQAQGFILLTAAAVLYHANFSCRRRPVHFLGVVLLSGSEKNTSQPTVRTRQLPLG